MNDEQLRAQADIDRATATAAQQEVNRLLQEKLREMDGKIAEHEKILQDMMRFRGAFFDQIPTTTKEE